MDYRERVNKFPRKYEEGFLNEEIEKLVQEISAETQFARDKFDAAMWGHTCLLKEEGIVIYPWDVEKAIECGLENRNLTVSEWD